MNDDQMDELLRQEARDYNEPGAVPREEMWARIEHERRARAAIAPRAGRAANRVWVWPSMGVAAALLVTAGIVIGRRMERSEPSPAQAVARAATTPAVDSSGITALAAASRVETAPDSASTLIGKIREATEANDRRARTLASAPRTRSNGADSRSTDQNPVPNLAYRLVVLQHLAGTEAMITSFRATAKRGEPDTLMVAWSRELLSTTRMLAASPAADDPVMKRLLQDLDFVIAEIVQYSAHGVNNPDELNLIEQSINERGVITKLRYTIPSRSPSAGT